MPAVMLKRAFEKRNADDNAVFRPNHFPHNCGYTYYGLCEIAEKYGFTVSYSSLEIDL